ncbi:Transmembrane protease serine 9, partial [Orchesella cincta]
METIYAFTTFPEGVELRLLTFLYFCYATFITPVRFQYDHKRQKYTSHTSIFRKVSREKIPLHTTNIRFAVTVPGPSGVIISGVSYGVYFVGIAFLVTFLSSRSHNQMLDLLNLIQGSTHDRLKGKIFVPKNICIIIEILAVSVFSIFAYTYYTTSVYFTDGIEIVSKRFWYSFVEMNKRKAANITLDELEWWKMCFGGFLVFSQLDQQLFFGVSLVLLIFLGKAINTICVHFNTCLRDSRRYYNVSSEEVNVIGHIYRIRKMFNFGSNSFGVIAYMVIITETLLACINLVWVFKSDNIGVVATISTFAFCSGCLYFLFSTAKASRQIVAAMPLLYATKSHYRAKRPNSSHLNNHILIYEISSREVGLGSSGFFVITYSFIGVNKEISKNLINFIPIKMKFQLTCLLIVALSICVLCKPYRGQRFSWRQVVPRRSRNMMSHPWQNPMGYMHRPRYQTFNHFRSLDFTGRIIGGSNANPGEIPYQLLLTQKLANRRLKTCGATLVNSFGRQFAVTAAHCVWDHSASKIGSVGSFRIIAGEHDIKKTSGDEQQRSAAKVVMHENYATRKTDDIAIVFYSSPFTINSKVKAIRLPRKTWAQPGELKVTGWGWKKDSPNPISPDILKVVTLPTLNNGDCRRRFGQTGKMITRKMICGLDEGSKVGACLGDSGGPAAAWNKTERLWYLAGVTSFVKVTKLTEVYWYLKLQLETTWLKMSTQEKTPPEATGSSCVDLPPERRFNRRQFALNRPSYMTSRRYTHPWQSPMAFLYRPRYQTFNHIKPSESLTGRIIGGSNAFPGDVPYQLRLTMWTSKQTLVDCGATLVHAFDLQFAITAAHCVWDDGISKTGNPSDVDLFAGELNLKKATGDEQKRTAVKIVVPEKYDFTSIHKTDDIALVFYVPAFKITSKVKPIELPGWMWDQPDELELSGWGRTIGKQNPTTSDILKIASLPTVNNAECIRRFGATGSKITWQMICGLDEGFKIGACFGDSGGPAASWNDSESRWYLAGITSFGKGECGTGRQPTVFTRVSTYITWIWDRSGPI